MAGTIPTVVYYGLGLLSVDLVLPGDRDRLRARRARHRQLVDDRGDARRRFVALAPLVGADPVIAAGAVISGAYFGDKMTPVSETTVLVPSMVGGVTTQRAHRRDDLDVRAGRRDRASSCSRSSA